MREILFRGKRIDNGAWVYGSLITDVFSKADSGEDVPFILCPDRADYDCFEDFDEENGIFEVIPETVGQYTGLTDKNGEKIFEGDIVRVTDDDGDTDFSDGGVGSVIFYDGTWFVDGQPQNGLYELGHYLYIEVIGNIHDPELLEETQ